MADYSMCPSTLCSVRATCGRNPESGQLVADEHQSWITLGGFVSENEKCSLYWKVEKSTNVLHTFVDLLSPSEPELVMQAHDEEYGTVGPE